MAPKTSQPAASRRPEIVVAGVLVLAAAGYFLVAALSAFVWQWRAHSRFVPVQATVVSATVYTRGGDRTSHGSSFRPHVVYRYERDGMGYRSDRYFFTGPGWADADAAAATVSRFAPGTVVEAYVDAADPQRAVLDRSRPRAGALLFLVPLAAAGVALVVYGARSRRAPPAN